MEMKYVFISHSSSDVELTNRLCDYLAKNKVCFWYDGILKGGNYAAQIGDKLIGASAYVLVASEKALKSKEVQREVEHMKDKFVIPLVLDDYYFKEDSAKGSITYVLGNNCIEAVIMNKYPSEEKAFERLVYLLQPVVMTWENDVRDFELGADGKKMIAYRGSDSFLSIPPSIEEVGARAVQANKSIESLYVSDSVSLIGESAFSGCKNLKNVSGTLGVTRCKKDAFAGTSLIQNQLAPVKKTDLQESEDYKSDVIYAGCIAVGGKECETLTVSNCTVIADEAFFGHGATEIEICEGVEYIGESAFRCCLDLVKVTLPRSLKQVGEKAFYDCFSLQSIVTKGNPIGLENACQNKSVIKMEEQQ